MFQRIVNNKQTHVASARSAILRLGFVCILCPMLARGDDRRCEVSIQKVEQNGPSAAYLGAAACDTRRGRMIISGGYDPPHKDAPRTFLELDLAKGAWTSTLLADPSPPTIGKPALVYDPKRDALFLFGGWAQGANGPSAQL